MTWKWWCPTGRPIESLSSSPKSGPAQADKPDAVVLAGDLTYADDYNADDRFGYQPRWDIWGRISQSLFSTIPLIAGIGPYFPFAHDSMLRIGARVTSRVRVSAGVRVTNRFRVWVRVTVWVWVRV